MRPTREGEEGYRQFAMICCDKIVHWSVEREDGMVYATWKCPSCRTEAYVCVGEPDVDHATIQETRKL
jgi:hypothetical protein